MVFGVPLVTIRYPNNAAVTFADKGAGLAVEQNENSFADASIKLLSDSSLWEKTSLKACEISEGRDIERIGKMLVNLLNDIISE